MEFQRRIKHELNSEADHGALKINAKFAVELCKDHGAVMKYINANHYTEWSRWFHNYIECALKCCLK